MSVRHVLGRTGLRANILFNIVGMCIPIAVALATVPLYIAHIGAARYGLMSIIWALLAYCAIADFGLARAATNALARLADGPRAERMPVLMTALYANALFGILGGALAYFACGLLFDHVVTLPAGLRAEVEGAMPWIAGLVPLTLIGSVVRGAIESRERFLAVNILDLIWVVLGQVLPLIAAVWIGPELTVLMPPVFAARLLAVVLALGFLAKTEKTEGLMAFDLRCLRELLGFGAWVSVSNVISPLLTAMDQLLIGRALGTAAVAHYAVPMNMVARSQVVVLALGRALFPRFSRLSEQEAKALAERAVVSLGYAYGAICGPALILGGPFMSLWVGTEFGSQATPVIQVLMIGAWANGLATISLVLLQGRQRPDTVAKIHMLELVPFMLLLWLLIHGAGLVGAAIAWTVRAIVDALLLLKLSRFETRTMARLLPPFVLLLTIYVVAQAGISAIWALVCAIAAIPLFVVGAILFDATCRHELLGLLGRVGSAFRASAISP